jgi:hypothetical protein
VLLLLSVWVVIQPTQVAEPIAPTPVRQTPVARPPLAPIRVAAQPVVEPVASPTVEDSEPLAQAERTARLSVAGLLFVAVLGALGLTYALNRGPRRDLVLGLALGVTGAGAASFLLRGR